MGHRDAAAEHVSVEEELLSKEAEALTAGQHRQEVVQPARPQQNVNTYGFQNGVQDPGKLFPHSLATCPSREQQYQAKPVTVPSDHIATWKLIFQPKLHDSFHCQRNTDSNKITFANHFQFLSPLSSTSALPPPPARGNAGTKPVRLNLTFDFTLHSAKIATCIAAWFCQVFCLLIGKYQKQEENGCFLRTEKSLNLQA